MLLPIQKIIPNVKINGELENRLAGNLNVTIPNGFLDSLKISQTIIKSPIVRYKSFQSNESCQLSFMIKNKVDDIEINITISGGTSHSSEKGSVDELINLADERLYIAKENGRNQIIKTSN